MNKKFSMGLFALRAVPTLLLFALGVGWLYGKFLRDDWNGYSTLIFCVISSILYFEIVIRLGLLPNLCPPITTFIKLSTQDKIVLIINFMGIFLVVILAEHSPTTDLKYLVMFIGCLAIYKFMGKWGSDELNSSLEYSSTKKNLNPNPDEDQKS